MMRIEPPLVTITDTETMLRAEIDAQREEIDELKAALSNMQLERDAARKKSAADSDLMWMMTDKARRDANEAKKVKYLLRVHRENADKMIAELEDRRAVTALLVGFIGATLGFVVGMALMMMIVR